MTPTDPNERARELKPCPFCGAVEPIVAEHPNAIPPMFRVICSGVVCRAVVEGRTLVRAAGQLVPASQDADGNGGLGFNGGARDQALEVQDVHAGLFGPGWC